MQIQKPTPITEAYIYPITDDGKDEDALDLLDVAFLVWANKWLVVGVTLLFALASVSFALSKPNIYRTTALLAPAIEETSRLSDFTSQYSGLASLAGVNLGNGNSSSTNMALAVLTSRQFLSGFINRHELKMPLFAASGWDEENGEIIIDSDIYNVKDGRWVREVAAGKSAEPSDLEAYKAFRSLISVTLDGDTDLITIQGEFFSPVLIKQWLDWLIADINQAMREKDLADVEMKISYLQDNLENIRVADVQTVFYHLIEEQLKTKMLAQVHSEYAFKTIDPAVVPERKHSPGRAQIAVFGTICGGMFSVALVLLVHAAQKYRQEAQQKVNRLPV